MKKVNSGEVFEINNNGAPGKSLGFYVTPRTGKPYVTQMPPPLETETLEVPENKLSQPITPAPKTSKNNNMLRTQLPPSLEDNESGDASEDIESEAPEGENKSIKSLSQNGGSMPVCGSCPFPGTGYCDFYARGGRRQGGGGCGCGGTLLKGGYKPTRKNLKYLKKWRKGESIGFTMTASLKAKGLIPRTSRKLKGKKVVSRKYR